jgi:hypothetical protein
MNVILSVFKGVKMVSETEYREFVQSVIDNVKKNGFPDKKVAFPLEQMYEIAEKKGINFNKVLQTLDEIQIAHEKTPEKIVFFPKDRNLHPSPESSDVNPKDAASKMAANLNPDMLKNLNPDMLKNLNMDMFKNFDMKGMMSAAAGMMKNLSPEQLKSMKDMYENMSPEERAKMMDQFKNMF